MSFSLDYVAIGKTQNSAPINLGITLFTLFHNPTELRQKTVNQKGENKSAVLKGNRTQDPSVMVQCATDYATAASSLDSLLLYLINVTNEISCI